jgi:elongation factor P--beta-lysine ligase
MKASTSFTSRIRRQALIRKIRLFFSRRLGWAEISAVAFQTEISQDLSFGLLVVGNGSSIYI